jgi:hypothetical protein
LPVGVAIIRALKAKLDEWQQKEPEKLEIRLGTPVIGLVTWKLVLKIQASCKVSKCHQYL